jgi:hypothetical protein
VTAPDPGTVGGAFLRAVHRAAALGLDAAEAHDTPGIAASGLEIVAHPVPVRDVMALDPREALARAEAAVNAARAALEDEAEGEFGWAVRELHRAGVELWTLVTRW